MHENDEQWDERKKKNGYFCHGHDKTRQKVLGL